MGMGTQQVMGTGTQQVLGRVHSKSWVGYTANLGSGTQQVSGRVHSKSRAHRMGPDGQLSLHHTGQFQDEGGSGVDHNFLHFQESREGPREAALGRVRL